MDEPWLYVVILLILLGTTWFAKQRFLPDVPDELSRRPSVSTGASVGDSVRSVRSYDMAGDPYDNPVVP